MRRKKNARELCIDCQMRPGTVEVPCEGVIYYRCSACIAACEAEAEYRRIHFTKDGFDTQQEEGFSW